MTRRVRSVLTGLWPASGHTVNTGVQGVLTGASGHPVEAHNGSFLAYVINTTSFRVWGYFCSFQQLRKHLRECQEEQGPSEVIEI